MSGPETPFLTPGPGRPDPKTGPERRARVHLDLVNGRAADPSLEREFPARCAVTSPQAMRDRQPADAKLRAQRSWPAVFAEQAETAPVAVLRPSSAVY